MSDFDKEKEPADKDTDILNFDEEDIAENTEKQSDDKMESEDDNDCKRDETDPVIEEKENITEIRDFVVSSGTSNEGKENRKGIKNKKEKGRGPLKLHKERKADMQPEVTEPVQTETEKIRSEHHQSEQEAQQPVSLEKTAAETKESHRKHLNSETEKKEKSLRKIRKKVKTDAELDDELEFITHESVRDKSKMAEGTEIQDEFVSKKKTKRRSVDAEEAKKEKVQKIAKNNIHFIIIGIVAIIVIISLISFGVRHMIAKKAASNKEQPVSAQEYEKDGYEQINELISNYYQCYEDGDTETILQYAYPMTDSEKSYIQMYSQYVDEYQNITCYTKTGADDKSYIVSVSFYVKYKDVSTSAPGMDFFYVREDDKGEMYIDNVYSPFNLVYQEHTLDQTIVQLIQSYESGEDVIALQAGVQTSYEQMLEQDADLKNMVEVTIANAVSNWQAEHEAAMEQKAEEAQQQVQQEAAAEEQAAAEQAAQEQAAANAVETENRAWVYVNDTVNIRQEPNESSAVLASATKGSQVRQLATREDGWIRVKTGDIEGYIKAEFISAEAVSNTGGSLSEGQTVRLTSSVNIRSAMSENSERIGLAYSGETVTVIQNYSEGWTKVNWNGQIGYIRTDVLAGM